MFANKQMQKGDLARMNDFESVFQRFSHSTEEVSILIEEISVAPVLRGKIDEKIRVVKSAITDCDTAIQEFTDELILSGQYAAAGKNAETRDAWLRKQIKDGLPIISKKRDEYVSLLTSHQCEIDEVRRRTDACMKVLGFLQSMTENATALSVSEEQMKGCRFAREAVDYLRSSKEVAEAGMVLHKAHMANDDRMIEKMGVVLQMVSRDN